jgi:hypothetical protein
MSRDVPCIYEDYMSGMWQDVPCLISSGHLYLNFDLLGVDLRTNTKKVHVLKRDWIIHSKYINHSRHTS